MASLSNTVNALGEVANLAVMYGMINKVFDGFEINGVKMEVRKPNETMKFPLVENWKWDTAQYLRTWLQAAMDNNEFGLLDEWNYNKRDLFKTLFKYTDLITGKELDVWNTDVGSADYQIIQMSFEVLYGYLDGYTRVNDIRNGFTPTERLGLKGAIKRSKEFSTHIGYDPLNPQEGVDRKLWASSGQTGNHIVFHVKDSRLTPHELVATSINKIWEETYNLFDLFGYEDSPYFISKDAHENAHEEARDHIWSQAKDILYAANQRDIAIGKKEHGPGYKHKLDEKDEAEKGIAYTDRMGNSYHKILSDLKSMGPDSMNYNDELIAWQDKYDKEFRELSEVSKVAATLHFLRGFSVMQGQVRFPISIPPTSETPGTKKNPKNNSLLDWRVMKEFLKEYNDIVANKSRRKVSQVDILSAPGISIEKLIRDGCK